MASSHSIDIFKEIEGAILSGKFKPRERLTEMGLMAIYGAGRTVIRETLKKLEAKGLVTIIPFRGAVVTDLTPEEVEEIYFLRAIMERIAADLVIQSITAREIQDLKRVLGDVERHMRNREASPTSELDTEIPIFRSVRQKEFEVPGGHNPCSPKFPKLQEVSISRDQIIGACGYGARKNRIVIRVPAYPR